jgi:nicotinate-nucleotide--dimethylbenzimidazole phosphoribosyltransferase
MVRTALAGQPALGKLASLAEWVAGVHPGEAGSPFTAIRAVILGAEPGPGVAEAAAVQGVSLRVITDLPTDPAGALAAGVAIADAEADRGTDLVVLAVPGVGVDAALAVSVLTNTEPVKVLSRGAAATDPEAWMAQAAAVRDRRLEVIKHRENADEVLRAIDSPRLAAATGFALRAAGRRTPVVLDGPTAAAAALAAFEAQPHAVRWWTAADSGPDAMHSIALTRLGQQALLGLGSGLGDGLAGVLVVPLLQAAARLGT